MKNTFLILLFASFWLLAGCASYTIQPVSATDLDGNWKNDQSDPGYIFYQPELYFLVTPAPPSKPDTNSPSGGASSGKTPPSEASPSSAFSVTPVYLPNPQKPYRVTTCNFLAKSDFAFNFKDGWQLSSIADKADNTTIANTLAGQLGTILSAAKSFNLAKQQEAFLLHPDYDTNGIINGFSIVTIQGRLP